MSTIVYKGKAMWFLCGNSHCHNFYNNFSSSHYYYPELYKDLLKC